VDEERRKKRGHRRGRGRQQPPSGPPHPPEREDAPEITEESAAPGTLRFRLRFWGRRSREGQQEPGDDTPPSMEKPPERGASPAAHGEVSPLAFWRRGRVRTYRQQPIPKQTLGRTLRRIQGLHVPPWTPVAFIIVVVFGILGALLFVRSTAAGPLNGDHWHATYEILVCGERQPNIPNFEAAAGSPGTHADGIMHQHPFAPEGEGAGSNLRNFYDKGGGKLTESEMRIPGTPKDQVYKNGDLCDDGRPAKLQVFVNDAPQDNFLRYIAKDSDRVRIVFGPEEVEPIKLEDRTIIAEDQATSTVEVEISGGEADVAFSPPSFELSTGETVKLAVTNTGTISHGLRVAGPDGVYETSDDYVSEPEIIPPGEEAVVMIRFDKEGEFEFRDPTIQQATGIIAVQAPEEEEEKVEETEAVGEVDVTFDVEMGDNFFQPTEMEVEVGQTFRINLTNIGGFVHNVHIAGPDGEYETSDDIESEPSFQRVGETGSLVAQIDEPGVYEFRCDFHPTEQVGTITVR